MPGTSPRREGDAASGGGHFRPVVACTPIRDKRQHVSWAGGGSPTNAVISVTSSTPPCRLSPQRAGPAPAPPQNLATRASRGGLSLPGSARDARAHRAPASGGPNPSRAPPLTRQSLGAQGELQLEAGVGIVQLLAEQLAQAG